ncbi:MAG TPA: site-specific integrase [Phycisphaerales bacterium]|nr:site-specific integrase [Phycisphaerales bacterium]
MKNVKVTVGYDPRNKKKPHICRWFGVYDPHTGNHRRYSKSFRLKVEAEQFAAQKTVEFQKGGKRDKPDEIALKVFCADWLKTKRVELQPATVQLYKYAQERLLSYFGSDYLLSDVSPRLAARFIAEQKRQDYEDKELSNWTRHRILRNCKTMFQSAVDWELITQNPFKLVKAPKCITKHWHYLKPKEYKRLLEVSPSLKFRAFYALAYTAGLRKGELLNLTWTDIDFESGDVLIRNRPATDTLPPFFIKDQQTRNIKLPKHTLNILTLLQNAAPERVPYVLLDDSQYQTVLAKWQRFRKLKRPWRNQDMANNVLRNFKRHLKWAEIKPIGTLSIHTLRKSCIQNWANNLNNPEVVRVLAGHEDIATTMKFYSQVDQENRAKAAMVVDNLLGENDVNLTYKPKQKANL